MNLENKVGERSLTDQIGHFETWRREFKKLNGRWPTGTYFQKRLAWVRLHEILEQKRRERV